MDRASIEDLYRKHGPMILRRARALLGDEQAAKDAMQEVFIRALRSGSEFRGEASPVTWLYRVTTNYCLNVIRDAAQRRKLLDAQGPPAAASLPTSEMRASVRQILSRVPEELADIAVYYFVDQMKQDEIAQMLGISRRTVGNRLEEFRALIRDAETTEKGAS